MLEPMTQGITPVYNLDKDNDGILGGGGGGIFIFFLFFLLAFNGNGGGLFGGGNANQNMNQITNDFLFSNLNNSLGRLSDNVADGFGSTQKGICDLGYTVNSNINALSREIADCCCTTNRNIDNLRYDGAKNTCDIITNANYNTRDLIANQTANTQRIVDIMTQDKMDSLRTELQSAQLQLSQLSQTEAIIGRVRPCPVPAYPTCNPWGCNAGCGSC